MSQLAGRFRPHPSPLRRRARTARGARRSPARGTRLPSPRRTPGEWWARHRRWLSALCVFVAVWAGLRAVAPAQVPTREAWVLTTPQAAGHTLGADEVRRVSFPLHAQFPGTGPPAASDDAAETAASGASSDWIEASVVGRTLAVPWPAGLPLHEGALTGSGLLRSLGPGEVAVPLSWDDAAAARLISSGDRVDVVLSIPRDGEAPTSRVLAEDARVLWCEAGAQGEQGWLSTDRASGATVVLAVPRSLAAELSSAPQHGAVSLVLTR
ncbi:Flp pilus assembly protein CpaB [Galactobacter valiniphilus]|uniref:Flp pilus assembly protein CpaB n=1 Tax=Galactobacter valiniphilus TaxID=2676122 RepID=UPI003734DD16